jgi:hypothetical protein
MRRPLQGIEKAVSHVAESDRRGELCGAFEDPRDVASYWQAKKDAGGHHPGMGDVARLRRPRVALEDDF